MAFPEDTESRPAPRAQYANPMMAYDTATLFALLLQFGTGVMSLITWVPSLMLLPLLIGEMPPTGPVNPIGVIGMIGMVPIALIQLFFAWKLYNKQSGGVTGALVSDLWATIVYVLILVTSIMTDTMSTSPQMFIAYIGVNAVLVILLLMQSVKDQFEAGSALPDGEYAQNY
jgi:hypothetical protein